MSGLGGQHPGEQQVLHQSGGGAAVPVGSLHEVQPHEPLFGEGVGFLFLQQPGKDAGIAAADVGLLFCPQDGGGSAGFFFQPFGAVFDCVEHRQ